MEIRYTTKEVQTNAAAVKRLLKAAGVPVEGKDEHMLRRLKEGDVLALCGGSPFVDTWTDDAGEIAGIKIWVPEQFMLRYIGIVAKLIERLVPIAIALKGLFGSAKHVFTDFRDEWKSLEKDVNQYEKDPKMTKPVV